MKQVFWPPFKLDENFHIIKFDLNFKQISVDIKIFSVLIFLTYILSQFYNKIVKKKTINIYTYFSNVPNSSKDLLTCNKTRIYKTSVCDTQLTNKSCQVLKIKITHLPCYIILQHSLVKPLGVTPVNTSKHLTSLHESIFLSL